MTVTTVWVAGFMCRAWAEGGALSGGGAYLAVALEEKLAEEEGLGGGGEGGGASQGGRPASQDMGMKRESC